MDSQLKRFYDQKREAYAAWRTVMDAADGRVLTAEEKAAADAAEAAIDTANEQISQWEEKQRMEQKIAAVSDEIRQTPPLQLQREVDQAAKPKKTIGEKWAEMSAAGMSRTEIVSTLSKVRDAEADAAFSSYLRGSYAALQKDVDPSGGFLLAPEQFLAQLIQNLDNMVWFRQFATVIPVVGAQGIGVPTLATDIGDVTWTTELNVGNEDNSLAFGKRSLTPHPLARYIKVSKDLLRSAALSVEAIVRERLTYKFGTVQEAAFMTGNGASQPLGVFTASASGVTTSQDVSTDNTTTAFTADGLINAKYALTGPWLMSGNLRWVMHRDAVKMARKLKDGDGQYIWAPGLATDRPDQILGVPVLVSEYAPNTFTTAQYVGLIGDLSYYWIAENMSVEIQRLTELGALTNQDLFIGRMSLDGMPILSQAFVRVKLA